MRLQNEGLNIWYGTPDAPAPGDDGVVSRAGVSVIVGASPASPLNAVQVRFRVDGGRLQEVPASQLRLDAQRGFEYFVAQLPALPRGDLVEYGAVLRCGGRQVPAPHQADRLPIRFRLPPVSKGRRAPGPPRVPAQRAVRPRWTPASTFVAHVSLNFDPPQYIGDTAAGARLNYFVRTGTLSGPGVSGRVLSGSGDHLLVRQDGVGLVRVRGALVMDDGALLDVEYEGYVDFGPDGHRLALANALPDRSPLVLGPLISTRHPKYAWLSRVQCLALGETHLRAGHAWYDLFTLAPRQARAGE